MYVAASRSILFCAGLVVLVTAAAPLWGAGTAAPAEFSFHQDGILGTSLDLTVVCRDKAQAEAALQNVLDETERLRKILSTYDPASEISRLAAATGPVKCSPELIEVLEACEAWRVRSAGAFNAQLGDLIALWTDAAKADRLPDQAALAAAAAKAAKPLWQIDKAAGTVARIGDVRPNIDAMAKGYIIEKAARAAKTRDPALAGLLLAIGGDIRILGAAAEGPNAKWLIGVVDPQHSQENAPPLVRVRLGDAAITTSGHYEHFYMIGGKRYSHIFDPRTGRPVESVAGATVIAPDASTADALSTTLCVLPPAEGLKLAASVPGVQCLIVGDDGKTYPSPGWKALEVVAPAAAPAPAASGATWPAGFAVNITLELAAQRKRPIVAVWVEDAAGKAVRAVTVWGNERKYLKNLPAWWAQYRNQADVLKATTRATRPAGRYQVVWDGLDDAGKPVKPGRYTLRLETAQEKGPHQNLSGVIACEKSPATLEIAGNSQIKGVTIAFGPAAAKS